MKKHRLILALLAIMLSTSMQATVYNCSSTQQITDALQAATAGDEIVIAPGTYTTPVTAQDFPTADGGTVSRSFYFRGAADGTESAPITIRSQNTSDQAILSGSSWQDLGYVLYITGDYWIIKDLKLTEGAKGLILDNSNNSRIENIEVYNIGQESIHVRDASNNTIIDGANVHDGGLLDDGFGEGIYVGSDNSVWWEGDGTDTGENGLYYRRACHNTVIKNCTIGPNLTAEPLEIKEGTENTIVEYCTIYGSGISGNNYADSHCDIKGTWAVIRHNTFYQENNSIIEQAIMIVPRMNAGVDQQYTGHDNYIHDNTFNLEDTNIPMIQANTGSENIYAWNNTRIPDGDDYSSRVTEAVPSGYDETNGITTYSLTVSSGFGSGDYAQGQEVNIEADAIDGKTFSEWTGDIANVDDVYSSRATLTMPATNISVTATYTNDGDETFSLTVENGTGGGTYTAGEVVSITANTISGQTFDKWTGATVANASSESTTLTMPAANVTVTATYKAEGAVTYNVATLQELIDALNAAQAGDEIVVAAGTYENDNVMVSGSSAYFYGAADGTSLNPITIRSADPDNKAVLKGDDRNSLTVLRIIGDYWVVKDLKITYGQKGLVFDNSNYSQAINCEVWDVGNEAVHVRDGSDYVTLDGLNIHDTGLDNAGFGEGIYIGTDKGSWSSYDPYVDYTTVKNCIIGPNVRAEAFDIKEGSTETVVEYCEVDATGISGSNYADSFIDLKGTRTYVRYNTFTRNNASNLTKGIAAIDRDVELSSYEHAVHDNVFNMDVSTGNIVEAYSGTADVYAWNNTRNPSGDMYNSGVIPECCPSWYDGADPVQYTLTTSAVNGSVNPSGGSYNANASVTIEAKGSTGYRFDYWSGDASGSTNPLTLTMDADKNITAHFVEVPTYNLGITASNGTVDPDGGTFSENETVELTASGELGYTFDYWSGDLTGSENPASITMNADKNITAHFVAVPTYTLATSAANGTVTPSSGTYNEGDVVNLQADPDPGYKFISWSGDASGSTNPYALTMNGNKSVTAEFALQVCDEFATPDPTNWLAENAWSADDDVVFSNEDNALKIFYPQYGKSDVYLIQQGVNTDITADELYTVSFDMKRGGTEITDIQVGFATDYAWDGPTSYIVDLVSAGGGINVLSYTTKEVTFTPASSGQGNLVLYVTFAEQPDVNNDLYLKNISICSGSGEIPVNYTLTTSAGTGGSVDPTGSNTYTENSSVTVTATVTDDCYTFSGWSGASTSTENQVTITMDADKELTANFSLTTYNLTTTAGEGGSLVTDMTATYDCGSDVNVEAKADEGYKFAGWSGDASGTTNPLTVTMDTTKTITANFTLNDVPTYTLTTSTGTGGSVDPAGSNVYDENTDVTVTATVTDDCYEFSRWSGASTSTENPLTITMDADKELTANFSLITYNLTTTAGTGGSLVTDMTGTYDCGSSVNVEAKADEGYSFTGWSGDASGTTNPLNVTMDVAKAITANFTEDNNVTIPAALAQYLFEGNANDAAGSYNGTVNGASFSANAVEGSQALSLDGSNDNVTIDYNVFEQAFSTRSVTAWVKLDKTSGVQTIYEEGGAWKGLTLNIDNGTLNARARQDNAYNLDVSASFSTTEWSHVAVVFDNGTMSLYIDGVLANQSSNSNVSSVGSHSNPAGIGATNDGDTYGSNAANTYLDGSIDDLRVFTQALTSQQIAMLADVEITEPTQYTLTTLATTGGSVTAGGTYDEGTSVQITATENSGYTFTGWSGDASGITNPLTVTMDATKAITANFTLNDVPTYTLTTSAGTGGSVDPAGSNVYDENTDVTVTATVTDDCYEFSSWSGASTSTENPLTINMDADKELTANFSLTTYNLTTTAGTGGSLVTDMTGSYDCGDVVTVEAKADEGYTFTGWSGNATGTTNPLTVTMDASKAITASFAIDQPGDYINLCDLTFSSYDNQDGNPSLTIQSDCQEVAMGGNTWKKADFSYTVTANTYLEFEFYSTDEGEIEGIGLEEDNSLSSDRIFKLYGTQNWGITDFDNYSGSSWKSYSINLGAYYTGNMNYLVLANDNDGGSGNANFRNIRVYEDGEQPATYTLTTTVGTGGSVDPAGSNTYTENSSVTVTATVTDDCYTFSGWSGASTSTSNPLTLTMDADKELMANFSLTTYNLTTTAGSGGSLVTDMTGTYDCGSSVNVEAKADEGYTFTGWSGDASGTTNPLTVTMDATKAITANFTLNNVPTYTLTTSAGTGGSIDPSGSNVYNENTDVTVTATVTDDCYIFFGWSGASTSTENPLTITMDADKELTANFNLITYNLTTTAGTGGSLVTDMTGSYDCGDVVTVEAKADEGYSFTGWSGDASGTTNPLNVTMDVAKAITANFEEVGQSTTITVRARLLQNGPDEIELWLDDVVTETWTVSSTSYADFTYEASGEHNVKIYFQDDAGNNPDMNIDYIQVGQDIYQAEDQATNTSVWQGQCGGSYSEDMHCPGYIDFGTINFGGPVTPTYTLTTSAGTGGSVDPAGSNTYNENSSVTVTATVTNDCYEFSSWSGASTSTSNPLTITMDADKELTANFSLTTYNLTTTAGTGGSLVTDMTGTYDCGSSVNVEAKADEGYSFTGWSGDASGTTNPLTVTMDATKAITASFTLNDVSTYSLTVENGSGDGNYEQGTEVPVSANNVSGQTFIGWAGDISYLDNANSSNATVTMPAADIAITATYESDPITYSKPWHQYLKTDIPQSELNNNNGAGLNGRAKPTANPVTGSTIVIDNSAADDRITIQNAIDNASYGDEIYLTNGVYELKSYNIDYQRPASDYEPGVTVDTRDYDEGAILLRSGINLRGESQDGVIIKLDPATGAEAAICALGKHWSVTNVHVSNMTVSTTSGYMKYGIRLWTNSYGPGYVNNIVVENVTVENFDRRGYRLETVEDVLLRNCTAQLTDEPSNGYGFEVYGDTDHGDFETRYITLELCEALGPNMRHGFIVQDKAHHILIERCYADTNYFGAIETHASGEHHIEIFNCVVERSRSIAIKLTSGGGGYNWVHHNTIINTEPGKEIVDETSNNQIEYNDILTGIQKGAPFENESYAFDNNSNKNINFYPNPAENEVFVVGANNMIKNIYSLSGTLMITTRDNLIDVSALQPGAYILKIENLSNTLMVK